jgi:hypothetical protein
MKNLKHLVLNAQLCLLAALAPMQLSHAQVIAPEQASFEPVDATDMVNLLTGDMSWNLPLLQVPSPEGGYPITLFYHGGIGMMQESSWVGLGWNINPGSINRSVSGIADDVKNSQKIVYAYDPGEEYSSTSVGVGVTFGAYTSGLRVGYTGTWGGMNGNRSFSGTVSLGVGVLYVSQSMHYNTHNKSSYASIGLQMPIADLGENMTVVGSVSYDGDIVSFGAGVSVAEKSGKKNVFSGVDHYNGISLFSIRSSGHNANFTSMGMSATEMITSPGLGVNVIEDSWGFQSPPIPIVPGISVDFSFSSYFFKWWIDYERTVYNFGTLYSLQGGGYSQGLQKSRRQTDFYANDPNKSMDVNEMQNTKSKISNLTQNEAAASFMYPAYDQYNVYSQGLSGTMQVSLLTPSVLCGERRILQAQHSNDKNPNFFREVWYATDFLKNLNTNYNQPHYPLPQKHQFRFLGTNSSYYRFLPPHYNSPHKNELNYGNANQITSLNGNTTYNSTLKKIAFGKHIEYFLNSNINSGEAYSRGFMECEELHLKRNNFLAHPGNSSNEKKVLSTNPDGIGAFYIIKEDGLKYHYSLPVYQFESFNNSWNHFDDRKWVTMIHTDPTAINWLLTAITGPDYVDNLDNLVGQGDLGYWVKFSYGLWTDGFIDRSPMDGHKRIGEFEYDDEGNVSNQDEITEESFASRRQIYYLNTISTRTHTALFIKDLKYDYFSANSFKITGRYNLIGYKDEDGNLSKVHRGQVSHNCLVTPSFQPTLMLKELILIKNEDLENISLSLSDGGNSLPVSWNYFGEVILYSNNSTPPITYDYDYLNEYDSKRQLHHSHPFWSTTLSQISKVYNKYFGMNYQFNILDVKDIDTKRSLIEEKALKHIVFNYDYSLKKNKILPAGSIPVNQGKGSLTLKSVSIEGKGSVKILPSYNFLYQKNPDVDTTKLDYWGYKEEHDQDSWSLTEIEEPIGAKTKFIYESDHITSIVHRGWMQTVNSPQFPNEGGIRVREVSRYDAAKSTKTEYIYKKGVAPMTPYSLNGFVPFASLQAGPIVIYGEVDVIHKNQSNQYQNITTYSFDNNYNGKLLFEELPDYIGDTEVIKSRTRRTVVHNKLSSFGNLKSIVVKNIHNVPLTTVEFNYPSGHLSNYSQGIYQESHVSTKIAYGLSEYKNNQSNNSITSHYEEFVKKYSVSSIIDYPNIVSSIVETDHISGLKTITRDLSYDFLSGQPVKSENIDSHKTSLISVTQLAYKTYLQMGPLIGTIGNIDYNKKNMLSPIHGQYSYIGSEGLSNLISASKTTYNSSWNYLTLDANGYLEVSSLGMPSIFRVSETFSLITPRSIDGRYLSTWADFVIGNSNPMWKNHSKEEIYDKYSHPVQYKNSSGVFSSNHIEPRSGYISSKAVNSNIFSFTHSSFEHSNQNAPLDNIIEGNVQILSSGSSLTAHSGEKYISVPSSSNNSLPIFKQRQKSDGNGLMTGIEYTLSAWVNAPANSNAKLNIRVLGNGGQINQTVSKGFNDPSNLIVGSWRQLTLKITVPPNYTTTNSNEDLRVYVSDNSTPVFIDDFRVAPSNSIVEGFVYDRSTGWLIYRLDNNNFYTRTVYDTEGRVTAVFKETPSGERKVNEFQYNYSRN